MSSARLASKNCSPNAVLSKVFLFVSSDFVLGCIDIGLLLLSSLLPLLLFEEAVTHPHRGGNGFPMHAGRFDLRFNIVRILRTLLVIFHGRLGRFETHIVEVLFLLRNDEP